MDHLPNGDFVNGTSHTHPPVDGIIPNGLHEPTIEQLERELPMVVEGQIPLGDLASRMAQAVYAELTELAETMPNMSDAARKRTLADFVVKTKKQIVKLYVAVKWARDASAVQKAMNVTAFLMDQNQQFEEAINRLTYAKDSLDPARLRNHDLLTSLDVLTTGSYRRLPSAIKKNVIPDTPLSDNQVASILSDMEDVIRYRLRMNEIIPPEMSHYRFADGRVHFTVPKLFEASLCLKGAHHDDGWFFVDVEFLFNVGGDTTGMQDFPRQPVGFLRRHIADEADARLAFYLPLPPDPALPPGIEAPPRPQLPEGVVDAPLVRVFNFLQMMSMSYQLEILWYQAERMRSLGWADYLRVEMSNDRKTLTISYWLRKLPPPAPGRQRAKLPLLGGTLTISIIPTQPSPPQTQTQPHSRAYSQTHSQSQSHSQSQPAHGSSSAGTSAPHRKPKTRILMELQQRAKLRTSRPSDEVEGVRFDVRWRPQDGTLGVPLKHAGLQLEDKNLTVDADDLDVETLLRSVVTKHSSGILSEFQRDLQTRYGRIFGAPGEIVLINEGGNLALRICLCADEVVIMTIDPRTGRIILRDTGDLAAAGRGPHFNRFSDVINDNPGELGGMLARLRFSTIADIAEQKANYLGLRNFRTRNFSKEEMAKLGTPIHGTLYIQLGNFPSHYLVLVITEDDFRYALISVKILTDTMYTEMTMEDIGWLDVQRVHGNQIAIKPQMDGITELITGPKRRPFLVDGPGEDSQPPRFNLETSVLRELYSYSCARVAYTKVEQQLKSRGLPYEHFNPMANPFPELSHIQSSLAQSIPALCVQSSDILSGAPAAEAAMPNIRVIPLNWWSERKAQVVTCVKLKYVQQPVGKRAGGAIIRPSKRIIYDTREAVVTFLSEDVDKCVDEFLEEWAKVSKMVVIAREVAQMATEKRWDDVRLLSFDLQTVEFAYSGDYAVSITCTDQLSPTGGSYELRFSRVVDETIMDTSGDEDMDQATYNPHEDIEPFVRNLLRHGRLSESLYRLVSLLRDTLPIVSELDFIRSSASKAGDKVETYAKTAGWYRVMFGDLRHALDFRLMSNGRVVIVDASNSLYPLPNKKQASASPLPLPDSQLTLRPIPNFKSLVMATYRDIPPTYRGSKVTPVDVGIVCESAAVRMVGRTLYEKVRQGLKEAGPSSGAQSST